MASCEGQEESQHELDDGLEIAAGKAESEASGSLSSLSDTEPGGEEAFHLDEASTSSREGEPGKQSPQLQAGAVGPESDQESSDSGWAGGPDALWSMDGREALQLQYVGPEGASDLAERLASTTADRLEEVRLRGLAEQRAEDLAETLRRSEEEKKDLAEQYTQLAREAAYARDESSRTISRLERECERVQAERVRIEAERSRAAVDARHTEQAQLLRHELVGAQLSHERAARAVESRLFRNELEDTEALLAPAAVVQLACRITLSAADSDEPEQLLPSAALRATHEHAVGVLREAAAAATARADSLLERLSDAQRRAEQLEIELADERLARTQEVEACVRRAHEEMLQALEAATRESQQEMNRKAVERGTVLAELRAAEGDLSACLGVKALARARAEHAEQARRQIEQELEQSRERHREEMRSARAATMDDVLDLNAKLEQATAARSEALKLVQEEQEKRRAAEERSQQAESAAEEAQSSLELALDAGVPPDDADGAGLVLSERLQRRRKYLVYEVRNLRRRLEEEQKKFADAAAVASARYAAAQRYIEQLTTQAELSRQAEERGAVAITESEGRRRALETRAAQFETLLSESRVPDSGHMVQQTMQSQGEAVVESPGGRSKWLDADYAWEQYITHGTDAFLKSAIMNGRKAYRARTGMPHSVKQVRGF